MPVFLNILVIAISLSLDTFSLSLSYGMFNLSNKIIYKISLSVGIFHFIMPLIGNWFGDLIYKIIVINENIIIGIIFMLLSIEMINSLFNKGDYKNISNFVQVLLFSFAVSLDSFSVGIAMDAISNNRLLVVGIFMIVSCLFTFIGLYFGKRIKSVVGKKAELIGILLLLLLSINYILKGF